MVPMMLGCQPAGGTCGAATGAYAVLTCSSPEWRLQANKHVAELQVKGNAGD
jgi:hypothetical protein